MKRITVDQIISKMTLEQKAAQLINIKGNAVATMRSFADWVTKNGSC